MRSTDSNAELRYLVEVDEAWQEAVLCMAYEGKFDRVADINLEGKLMFVERCKVTSPSSLISESADVAEFMHQSIQAVYDVDVQDPGPLADFIYQT